MHKLQNLILLLILKTVCATFVQTLTSTTLDQQSPNSNTSIKIVLGSTSMLVCTVPEGAEVQLICQMPHPIWYKNNHELYASNPLNLAHVRSIDAGFYSCFTKEALHGLKCSNLALNVNTSLQSSSSDIAEGEHEYNLHTDQLLGPRASKKPVLTRHERSDCCSEIANVTATENLPTFTQKMHTQVSTIVGGRAYLNCFVNENSKPNISWYLNDKLLKSDEGYHLVFAHSYLVIWKTKFEDSGNYKCLACNKIGCAEQKTQLTVKDPKLYINEKTPQNQTVVVNGNAMFECKSDSDLQLHFKWIRNKSSPMLTKPSLRNLADGDNTDIRTNPEEPHMLRLVNVTYEDAGWYTCTVINSEEATPASVYLEVVDELPSRYNSVWVTVAAILVIILFFLGSIFIICGLSKLEHKKNLLKHRIEIVHQWTKKVIVYSPPSRDDSADELQLPVIKIEKQRTTVEATGSMDEETAFNEYEFPLDSNWEIARNHVVLGATLGEGAFGRVVMAEVFGLPSTATVNNSSSIVAVKMVKEEHTDADMAGLVLEMEVMKLIGKHINIINLIGCCSQNGPLWVIVEFARHGNLKDFLKKNRPLYVNLKSPLTEKSLISFALQAARGMEYLASRKCIHRDLAARNVLVSDDYVIKIADFGLARDIHVKNYYRKNTNGLLPIKWMAPESLEKMFYDSQSDVWSYGVLLWEIMTYGEQPYPNIMSAEELYSFLIAGQRMEKPPRCSLNIYMLMRQCWNLHACARPNFVEISENLEKLLLLPKSSVNKECLDLPMPTLKTPPSSCDEEETDASEAEPFRVSSPLRCQYTYQFNTSS